MDQNVQEQIQPAITRQVLVNVAKGRINGVDHIMSVILDNFAQPMDIGGSAPMQTFLSNLQCLKCTM